MKDKDKKTEVVPQRSEDDTVSLKRDETVYRGGRKWRGKCPGWVKRGERKPAKK